MRFRHVNTTPPPDGRFLINTVLESAAAPITLVQPWNPDAKK